MDREILFRGFHKEPNGKDISIINGTPERGTWLCGDLIQRGDTVYVFPFDGMNSADNYKIVPATVGQYTGLTDKNGKKIFDGDVLRLSKGSLCVVKYGNRYRKCGFVVGYVNGAWDDVDNINGHDSVEVIGNIHDNPGLIGGEDDG